MALQEFESIAHFDAAAATWDENPRRREMTLAIANAIRQSIPLHRDMRVMEYGCGTAALSLLLADRIGAIVAADASPGMVEQVRRILDGHPGLDLTPVVLDLAQQPFETQPFDLITTAMAMHHMPDPPLIVSRFANLLVNGGWLAIADLCADDGSFHGDVKVPHNGFAPEALAETLRTLGFVDCHWEVAHQLEKNERLYDIFLLTARRP